MTEQTNTQAEDLREQARQKDQQARDSFERCDTDGFLSQWASGLTATKLRLAADLLEEPERWFAALFDLNGNRVRAKLYNGGYGTCWMFCDANDKPTGTFITAFPKRESTMAKKGYREDEELAPGKVDIVGGGGRGLAGAANCRAAIVRADQGYPEDAIPA